MVRKAQQVAASMGMMGGAGGAGAGGMGGAEAELARLRAENAALKGQRFA